MGIDIRTKAPLRASSSMDGLGVSLGHARRLGNAAGGVVYVLGMFVVTMVRTIAAMAACAVLIAAL